MMNTTESKKSILRFLLGGALILICIQLSAQPGGPFQRMKLRLPFSTAEKEYWVKKEGSYYVLNGDIIVAYENNDFLQTKSNARDNSLLGWDYRWTNAMIPIVIDQSIYDNGLGNIVLDALDEFNDRTELCLVPRAQQKDYVRITFSSDLNGAGGRSPVGRAGGEQKLLLGAGAGKLTVLHEMMHAAGFYHEQSREDRDNFVRILEDNVREDQLHNFEVESGNMFGPYDYCSIMHYSTTAFGSGRTTIECLTNGKVTPCPPCMGMSPTFSDQDIRGIDAFYNTVSRFPCKDKFPRPVVKAERYTTTHSSSGRQVAAVSRFPKTMEMWRIESDGSIKDAFWYEGANWQQFELAPAGSASPNGSITAVSRRPNTMEVWWIGANGSIQGAYWYEGSNWARIELAPAGSAALTSGISAVSRMANTMEVWWIAPNGSVQDAYWYEGGNWTRFEVAPPGSAAPTSPVAALSRKQNTMEVWWIAPNGSVQDAYWYEGGNWTRFEVAPPGSASQNGGLAAVCRIPGSMEVYWIGPNGSIQDAFWYEGGNWTRFELAPAGSASPNSPIAAISRIPTSMEVLWAGANGSLMHAFWYEGSNWRLGQLFPEGKVPDKGGLAGLSRMPGAMEFWSSGTLFNRDGSRRKSTDSFFWYEGDSWKTHNLALDVAPLTQPGGSFAGAQIGNGVQPSGTNCMPVVDYSIVFSFQSNQGIFLSNVNGDVMHYPFNGVEVGDPNWLTGAKVGGNGDELSIFAIGNRIFTIKRGGQLLAQDINGQAVGNPFLVQGDRIQWMKPGNDLQRSSYQDFRFLFPFKQGIFGIAPDGTVYGFDIIGNDLKYVAMIGSKVAWGTEDRFVFAIDDLIYVIKTSGEVWGHKVTGNQIGQGFKLGGSKVAWNTADDRFVFPFGQVGQNRIMVLKQSCGLWMHNAPVIPNIR